MLNSQILYNKYSIIVILEGMGMKIRKKIITLCAIALLSINVITAIAPSNPRIEILQDSSHNEPM